MTCNFRIVYSLRPASSIRTDRIALPHSDEQYGSKRGIFKLYQILCIGQPSQSEYLKSWKHILQKKWAQTTRKQMTNNRSVVQITADGSFTTKTNCQRTTRLLSNDWKWEAQENNTPNFSLVFFFLFLRKVLWLLSQPQWTYTLNFLSVLIHLFTPWLCVDALGKACFLDMLNYFRERLAPLVYSSHLRTEFRLIRWMQRKRLLKRNVNCTGCGNIMNFNACRRKRDGYQWYVPGFFVDRVTS